MWNFQESKLWLRTLAEHDNDKSAHERARLRVGYFQLRERASLLSAEIARDLPDFTVHDISHIDALWQMADIIAGPTLPMNALEGFVLGATFLLHDLGLGVAAYPEGKQSLHSDPLWSDSISTLLRRRLGRAPTRPEILAADESVKKTASEQVLRARHASRAQQLLSVQWTLGKDQRRNLFLMDDEELRTTYGPTIGKIAHSHWWDLSELRRQLVTTLGPAVGFPLEWSVGGLKLACLLRAADIAHIDARRAPSLVYSIRQPKGHAKDHWIFQNKVHQPVLKDDRLEYTAGSPFTLDEVSAWWLCFDTLRSINFELHEIDSLLVDSNEHRFVAKGVLGVDEPARLKVYVPTLDWEPVDTKIRITDVSSLVTRLGGEQLYGHGSKAPLRELIQNASDAVRARRLLDPLGTRGLITVRLLVEGDRHFLEVADNGIGMSTKVLTSSLLDFGTTFWDSEVVTQEHPGLMSKGYSPTGKFGIGFFSVFMWADVVTVVTRRYDEAYRDTRVLQFNSVSQRPILRLARQDEYLRDGGSKIRLQLRTSPRSEDGLLWVISNHNLWKLIDLVRWLCPASEVDISVEQNGKEHVAVRANDWLTIPGHELLKRLTRPNFRKLSSKTLKELGSRMQVIADVSGTPVARGVIAMSRYHEAELESVVTVDGFRHGRLAAITGVFSGTADVAARDSAMPLATVDQLSTWANGQRSLLPDHGLVEDRASFASVLLACRADASGLPIARAGSDWLNEDEVIRFAANLQKLYIVQLDDLSSSGTFLIRLKLYPNIIAAHARSELLYVRQGRDTWPPIPNHEWRWWASEMWSPLGSTISAIAKSWGIDVEKLLPNLDFWDDADELLEAEIGEINGTPFKHRVGRIIRPA